ncbi:hypothetical protein KAU33_14190 [Candidatus Dependentiae bacterium]|nr:hypothetical protein [Candidatus Dependentiae bacterium]
MKKEKKKKIYNIIIKVIGISFLITQLPRLYFLFSELFSIVMVSGFWTVLILIPGIFISNITNILVLLLVFGTEPVLDFFIKEDNEKTSISIEEQKTKERKQPYLMKRALLSTLSFGVLLFIANFVHTIMLVIQKSYLKYAESDPAKFYKHLSHYYSLNYLSRHLIMFILPMIGFFIGIAALSFTLKRRVPVFTAVLSALFFCFIYQWFWAGATDPDPYGAAMLFFILSPLFGGFSGVVAFVPMFFIENYLIKSKSKTIEKS